MRSLILRSSILIVLIAFLHACTIIAKKPLPPGHAKKVAGSQSAKEFAPGQTRKKSSSNSSRKKKG